MLCGGSGTGAGAVGAAVAVAAVVIVVMDMVSVVLDCFVEVLSMLCSCPERTVTIRLTGMGSIEWG